MAKGVWTQTVRWSIVDVGAKRDQAPWRSGCRKASGESENRTKEPHLILKWLLITQQELRKTPQSLVMLALGRDSVSSFASECWF